MTNNSIRKALIERNITFGTWIQIGHPAAAEILANTGFDWIAVDCEHTDIEIECFSNIARGMYGRVPVPLVRVRENNILAIRQVIDAGAEGVIVPLISTAEDAKKAVAAAKYPPLGVRGYAFSRVNNWGVDFDSYSKSANDDVAVIVMIETKQAVDNIDEILSVEGVDGVFIGPYDLSGSYGIAGQTSNPIVLKACANIVETCFKHSKSAGIHVVIPTSQEIKRTIDGAGTGYHFSDLFSKKKSSRI